MKSLRLSEDIKLSTIRSTSSRSKLKQRKWHLPNRDSSTRKKIRLCLITVESSKRRKRTWTRTVRELKISTLKFQSCIPSSRTQKTRGKRRRMSMNWLLRNVIFWVRSSFEEMINQRCSMKKLRSNKLPSRRVKLPLESG